MKSKNFPNNSFSKKKILAILLIIIAIGGISFLSYKIAKKNQIKNIINDLESKYDQQKYQECIVVVESKEARQAGVPEEKITELIGKCRLQAAKEQANSLKFSEAIAIAIKIPEDSSNYQEVQENIDLWSNKILEEANDIYSKDGNLEKALRTIEQIPPTSTVNKLALERANEWQQDKETNEAIIATARAALDAGDWEKALEEAKKVNGSSYWNDVATDIISIANKNINITSKQQQKRPPVRKTRPVLGSPPRPVSRPPSAKFDIPDNSGARPKYSIGAGTRAKEDECSDSSFESLCDQ